MPSGTSLNSTVGVASVTVTGAMYGCSVCLICRRQTAQNGLASSRIWQLNSGRKSPQWFWPAPSNAPTVPAATGLGLVSSWAQLGLLWVGTAVEDAIRSFHLMVFLSVLAVMLGLKGSGPV